MVVRGNDVMMDVFKVINWFRVKSNAQLRQYPFAEPLTQMKVMKLLYYVQGVSLAIDGEKVFPDDIVAWKYGPAVESVHEKYKGQKDIVGEITDEDLKDYGDLEAIENLSEILNAVNTTYGDKSAIELMNQSHNELPWKSTKQSDVIKPELMKEYFKQEIVLPRK